MEDVKRCQVCGKVISVAEETDYYRHIRIKYCDYCRDTAVRLQTAARVARLRERKKQKDALRDEQLHLLVQENELLRERVMQLREETGYKISEPSRNHNYRKDDFLC